MSESEKSKPRYVWDRDKLAWVEATPGQTEPEPALDTGTFAEKYDRGAEEVPAEAGLVEPAAEEYEEPEIKGAWARVGALAIDFILLGILNLAIGLIFSLEGGFARYLAPAIGVIYFVGFWAWRGQSLGKMLVGARIVKLDGNSIGIGRAFLRYIGYFIYLTIINYTLLVGWYLPVLCAVVIFLFMALSRDKRGLHDRLAGTIVINTRPRALEEYAEEEYEEEEPPYMEEAQEPLATGQA